MSRAEEPTPIDHEAIRAIGNTMAQSIGALAAESADRDSTLAFLNECAENVPYEALFAEDDRLATAIEDVDEERSAVQRELEAEYERLDGLVTTFSAQRSSQLAAAKALVEKKKTDAEQAAGEKDKPLSKSRASLAGDYKQISLSVESVAAAWPVTPYPEEVLEAVAAQYDETRAASEEDEDYDNDYSDDEPMAGSGLLTVPNRVAPPVVERVLGPHAELAARIPALSDRLERPVSEHIHAYDGIVTAKQTFDAAAAKPAEERSDEEENLTRAIFVLRRRFLSDPDNLDFLEVYEAGDVFQLARELTKFSRKNRPDFDDLEGCILDKAAARLPLLGRDVPADVRGAVQRMDEDIPGRRGMTWHSLNKHANRACDTMRARFFAGGHRNTHLKNYVIEVGDHSGKKPDLSWVYQFVADNFAFEVLATRRTDAQATTQERFIKNCDIITAWLEEAQEPLSQLPEDFRLLRPTDKRRHDYRARPRPRALYENVTAGTGIMNTVDDIIVRRDGTGDSRTLRHKPVDFDPLGALNHQLRLGHMVDALKEQLEVYAVPTEGHTEEITPFE